MSNLFALSDRQQILDRLDKLQAGATRQWGKMDVAQMCAHCVAALEVATSDRPRSQAMIGRLFAPFVKRKLLGGDAPFPKNSPTDPAFVVRDTRDFEEEKARLVALVRRFADEGATAADGRVHSFFGRLTGDEWGIAMAKHLDHHLKQFGT